MSLLIICWLLGKRGLLKQMNSECFRRRLNKAREQKDLIQKLPYFISWCVKYRPLVYLFFFTQKNTTFFGLLKKKIGGAVITISAWSLPKHLLRLLSEKTSSEEFSHLLITYTLVYIITAKWQAYFLPPPQSCTSCPKNACTFNL